MDDKTIVEMYQNRDEKAIEETERKFKNYLFKIAFNVLSDFEDSRECVNDTFLCAWKTIPPQKPEKLSLYLGKIVREIAIDTYRKKQSKKRYVSQYAVALSEVNDVLSDDETPVSISESNLLKEKMNQYLKTLDEEKRNIFVSRYYFFDSISDISEYYGMSKSKVKSVLYRTRQELKQYLEKEGLYCEK